MNRSVVMDETMEAPMDDLYPPGADSPANAVSDNGSWNTDEEDLEIAVANNASDSDATVWTPESSLSADVENQEFALHGDSYVELLSDGQSSPGEQLGETSRSHVISTELPALPPSGTTFPTGNTYTGTEILDSFWDYDFEADGRWQEHVTPAGLGNCTALHKKVLWYQEHISTALDTHQVLQDRTALHHAARTNR